MAEDISPNSLSGAPNATDELLEMVKPQPTPIPSMPAPQDGSVGPAPGFGPMAGLPPEPTKGGISEDIGTQFARQLAKNTDTLTQSNPAAVAKPGGWARAILGGAMTTLAGGGFSLGQPQPEGSVGINGVQSAVNAYKDRLRDSQNRAQAQKQQSFENDLKLRKEKREEEAQNAAIAFNKINIAKAQDAMDQEAQDRFHKNFYDSWAKDEKENKGATLIQEGMTSDDLKTLAKRHATSDDPNGSHWLAAQDVRPDGYRVDTDVNGDPVDQIGADGKPTGRHERTQTWAAYTYGDPTPMSAKTAADAKKYGLGNFSEGDTLKPQDAALLRVQIGKAMVDEQSADALALAAGKDKEALAELQQKADYRAAGTALTPWLVDSQGDVGRALQNMATHAQEKTPEGQEAAKQYNLVIKAFGNDIVKNQMELAGKKELETIKSNAAAAKNKPLEAEGETGLRGDAYLNSLPAARQPVMRMFVNGQLPPGQLQRMLSSKDGQQFLAEAALVDDQFDASKVNAYLDASKKFASDKIANQLNSANTSLVHLKSLFDDNNATGSLTGGQAYAKRQADLNDASLELARFLTGGTAPSNQDIASARASLDPPIHKMGFNLPSTYLNSAVKEQVERIREKIDQYQEQWNDAMPSPRWKRAMPGGLQSHPDAAQALEYIRNDGKVVSSQQTPSAPKAVSIGGKQVPLNADGTVTVGGHPYTISPDGKSLTLVSPGTK